MKKYLLLFSILSSSVFGQQLKPIDTSDFVQREALINSYKSKSEDFNHSIKKEYRGNVKQDLLDFYEYSQEEFIRQIQKKEFVFDTRFTDYLKELQNSINQKSSIKFPDLQLLISRSNVPNAFSLPGNIVIVNMGLFRLCENEDQLLSVICHELGHDYLKHSEKNILAKATLNNSDYLKENVKNIKKQKAGKNTEAFSFLKKILYSEGEKRRQDEEQADSLGYLLFKRIKPESKDFLGTLNILKDFDSIPSIEISKENYMTLFDLPNQPFQKAWLEEEDFSKYNYDFYKEKISEDSLKSHPEIDVRITKLKKDFPDLNVPPDSVTKMDTVSNFYNLKTLANQEVISNYIETEEYGKGIYVNMYRLLQHSEDTYLRKMLGQNFQLLYQAKKSYNFNKFVEYVTPEMDNESYVQFLSFLWNLRLDEMKTISEYYLQS